MNSHLIRQCFIFVILAIASSMAVAEEMVVIVNRQNTSNIDKGLVTRIFLGKTSVWENGLPIEAYDLPENHPGHDRFYTDTLGKSPSLVKTIWAQNIFTGKKLPPKISNPEISMKETVRANPNAIGYVSASMADSSVRVVSLK